MRINELIVESQQIDEISLAGIGKGIGKAANVAGKAVGGAVGGTVAAAKQFGQGVKQGYQGSKTAVGGGTTSPETDASPDPESLRKQAVALNQQADQLEKAASQPAPATTAPASTTTTPATTGPASTTTTPAQWPVGLPKFNSVTGQKFTSPEEAEQVTNSPEFKQQMADVAAGKDPGGVQATQQQPPLAPTTPAPTTPPAGGKMTQAQQDALKAKLQGQRQAGKTTATQTGTGFKDYVGGSQEKMTGVDASGAPVFKKLQRESVGFSNFLGMTI